MKISIDIRSTLKQKTGIGYYTFNFINSLSTIDKENRYYLYSNIKFFDNKKKLPPLPARNFSHRINRFNIDTRFFLKDMDILHTSSYDLSKPRGTRLVLVVHDVIHKVYPNGHTSQTIETTDSNLKRILKEVDVVIAVSQTTKKDLLRFYPFPEEKVRVIYPGVNNDFTFRGNIFPSSEYIQKKYYNVEIPFILSVSTLEPRKNIEGLIKAYKILREKTNLKHKLVIVGMKGWLYDNIFGLVDKLDLRDAVIFTGYVSREDLSYFYSNADIFVYPSFYEGVGLPVLEAFSYGLPVITSCTSALAEIAGDSAILIDPYQPEDIAKAILYLIEDNKLKEELKQKSIERAKEFSWEMSAKNTLEIFKELL